MTAFARRVHEIGEEQASRYGHSGGDELATLHHCTSGSRSLEQVAEGVGTTAVGRIHPAGRIGNAVSWLSHESGLNATSVTYDTRSCRSNHTSRVRSALNHVTVFAMRFLFSSVTVNMPFPDGSNSTRLSSGTG